MAKTKRIFEFEIIELLSKNGHLLSLNDLKNIYDYIKKLINSKQSITP